MTPPSDIDHYIIDFPPEIRERLELIREAIRKAAPDAVEAFKSELTGYKCTKGTIQIPHTRPIPMDLVERIVAFRVQENLQKKRLKK
jgi:uncharacterized protein YdhG (YjbR/CyaY superfamily)